MGRSDDHAPAADPTGAGDTHPSPDQLYRELAPRVASYLRSHGVADVGGTTNDVFLRVFGNLGGFKGDKAALRSWVFTIAHHLMVDDRRRRARRPMVDDGHAILEARAGTDDAEEAALASLGRERVDALLSTLSPDQRSVLLLRVVADLSIEQVATVVGKRVTAVKALQHRGLATLRRHLERGEVSR